MLARQHTSIDELDPQAWNALAGTTVPFLRHEFLAALEHTGCVGPGSGWTPAYFSLHDEAGLAAAAPAFIKSHSYGEFVFDFSWAEAYTHFGRNYYPKLSVCVPFTPATGARLLVRPDLAARWCAAGWPRQSRSSPSSIGSPRPMRCSSMSRRRAAFAMPDGCYGATASFTGPTRATATSSNTSRPSRPRSARRRAANGAG